MRVIKGWLVNKPYKPLIGKAKDLYSFDMEDDKIYNHEGKSVIFDKNNGLTHEDMLEYICRKIKGVSDEDVQPFVFYLDYKGNLKDDEPITDDEGLQNMALSYLKESYMNIREELNKLDWEHIDENYHLRNMYDACTWNKEDNKKIASLVTNNNLKSLYEFLDNKLNEDEEDFEDIGLGKDFLDKYSPIVNINDRKRYQVKKFGKKTFAYDKQEALLIWIFQDEGEKKELGKNCPWREADAQGLSYDNWKESPEYWCEVFADEIEENAYWDEMDTDDYSAKVSEPKQKEHGPNDEYEDPKWGFVNGTLEGFNPEILVEKTKSRGPLHTNRLHNNVLYTIFVFFAYPEQDENGNYLFNLDIISEDADGEQERLTSGDGWTHLTEEQAVAKLNEWKQSMLNGSMSEDYEDADLIDRHDYFRNLYPRGYHDFTKEREEASAKFKSDANKYDYFIIKVSKSYDPEGVSSSWKDEDIAYAGSKEACERKLEEIKDEAKRDRDQSLTLNSDGSIEVYYMNAISKVRYAIVKNNKSGLKESHKEWSKPKDAKHVIRHWDGDTEYFDVFDSEDEMNKEKERIADIDKHHDELMNDYINSLKDESLHISQPDGKIWKTVKASIKGAKDSDVDFQADNVMDNLHRIADKKNESVSYEIKPSALDKGLTRKEVQEYAVQHNCDYETALRRMKRIMAPESNYERVLSRLEPYKEDLDGDVKNYKIDDERLAKLSKSNPNHPEVKKAIKDNSNRVARISAGSKLSDDDRAWAIAHKMKVNGKEVSENLNEDAVKQYTIEQIKDYVDKKISNNTLLVKVDEKYNDDWYGHKGFRDDLTRGYVIKLGFTDEAFGLMNDYTKNAFTEGVTPKILVYGEDGDISVAVDNFYFDRSKFGNPNKDIHTNSAYGGGERSTSLEYDWAEFDGNKAEFEKLDKGLEKISDKGIKECIDFYNNYEHQGKRYDKHMSVFKGKDPLKIVLSGEIEDIPYDGVPEDAFWDYANAYYKKHPVSEESVPDIDSIFYDRYEEGENIEVDYGNEVELDLPSMPYDDPYGSYPTAYKTNKNGIIYIDSDFASGFTTLTRANRYFNNKNLLAYNLQETAREWSAKDVDIDESYTTKYVVKMNGEYMRQFKTYGEACEEVKRLERRYPKSVVEIEDESSID